MRDIPTFFLAACLCSVQAAKACLPQINWGASITFCQGNTFTLNAHNPNSTYIWSTGATTASIDVSTSGTYWVQVTNPCGTASDTIEVVVDQPVTVDLGPDRSICSSSPTVLSVPASPFTTYRWSTGATGSQISVNHPGTYFVSATNPCGTFRDTVQLTIDDVPIVSLGPDITRCDNTPTDLSLPASVRGSIQWSTGSGGRSITVSSSGVYWVQVNNACGTFRDTVSINYAVSDKLFASGIAELCGGGSTSLSSPLSGNAYLWSNGASTPSIQVTQPGVYGLRMTTICGFVYDTVQVVTKPPASVNLGSDTLLCGGASIILDAGNPGSRYLWSTGATSRRITVNTSGNFWVGVDNGCGFVYDSINIVAAPVPDPQISDTVYIAPGSTAGAIDAGIWGAQTTYQWSNGSKQQVVSGLTAGAHWVNVSNSCGTITRNFYVKEVAMPQLNLGRDTTICGGPLRLQPNIGNHANSLLWSNGARGSRLNITKSGDYWLQVTNVGGVISDTIRVTVLDIPSGIAPDTIYKCTGSSYRLSTDYYPQTSYQWSTGEDSSSINISAPGAYWLQASNQCGSISDTVYVIDVDPLQVDLGPDLIFCRPNWQTLDLTSVPADSFVWKNNKRGPTYRITSTGDHWVTVYNICGSFSDTVHATVNRVPQRVLQNFSFCSGSSVRLNAKQPVPAIYSWSTGDVTSAINVSQGGWYFVDISNVCGTIRDSVFLTEEQNLPPIDLGNDTVFCEGTLTLDPGLEGASYQWQNGSTTKTFTVTKSGTYHVTASNSCNSVSDTIVVQVTGPPKLALGNVVKFCKGSTLNLNARNPGSTYQWNTGEVTSEIKVTKSGKYWVTIANACGTLTDTVDVVVEDPLNHIDLGRDTIICRGDSVLLETNTPGVFAKWADGSASSSIYVGETGDYWVEVSNSCGSWSDTVHVEVQEDPIFSLGDDVAICAINGSVSVDGPPDKQSYRWSDGTRDRSLATSEAGVYWLTVSNRCFSYTDTIEIVEEYPIEIDLGPDTVLCHGESLALAPKVEGYGVTWNDNTKRAVKEVTRSGTYWVEAENSCGTFADTIKVRFDKHLDPEEETITICRDDSATFSLEGLGYDYEWFDGSTERERSFTEEGTYPVTITNKCGEFQKDFKICVSHCDCPFFVANAFTPNGDGLNDEFKIGHSCDLTSFSIQIYNRWGSLVFETDDVEDSWDGTSNGQPVPMGIYTYMIAYTWDVYEVDRLRTKTGTIQVMR